MQIAAVADAPPATSVALATAISNRREALPVETRLRPGDMSDVERIRVSIERALEGVQGGKLIAFTSARAGEGKTTALNALANHLVRARGHTVLVVDATGSHRLAHTLGVSHVSTLPEVEAQLEKSGGSLTPSEAGKLVVAESVDNLHAQGRPLQQLETLERLREAFDYVLIEFPSFADSSDIALNTRFYNGLIIVVEAGRTRWQVVQNLCENLNGHGGKILGVILNRRRYYVPNWLYRWF